MDEVVEGGITPEVEEHGFVIGGGVVWIRRSLLIG
jgi:hypothetical protein